jgi:hypothetical protein
VALVTQSFYLETFYGEAISPEDFARYETRAEDLVLSVIKRSADAAASLPEATLLQVRKAICAEIEYLFEYGVGVAVYGKEAGGGFTVGKVSVTNGGGRSKAAEGARSMIAPAVYVYLEQTELLNPAVSTADMPPLSWGWWP